MKAKEAPTVRQRILDTAARLFYQQGYPFTGINQLIAEAGVAKASLYQHFRTKDEILHAYLRQVSQQWFGQVEEAVASGDSAKAKVLAAFDLLKDFLVAVNFRGCNFQNAIVQLAPEEQEIRAFIQEHKQKMGRVFAGLVADAALAEELALLFEGALISSQIRGDLAPVATARRMAERLL